MTSSPDWPVPGVRDDDPNAGLARGCLSVLALYALAGAIVLGVWAAWPSGTGSPPPEPVPSPSSTYPRSSPVFPPAVDEVLVRAWDAGRHGCGITGPAVDDLAAALERDVAEVPPGDPRVIASRWVAERCAGR